MFVLCGYAVLQWMVYLVITVCVVVVSVREHLDKGRTRDIGWNKVREVPERAERLLVGVNIK